MKIPVTVYETVTDKTVTIDDVSLWDFDEDVNRIITNIGGQLYLKSVVNKPDGQQ